MIIKLDLSIYIKTGISYGQITGVIESCVSPFSGSLISFQNPIKQTTLHPFGFWGGFLEVDKILIIPQPSKIGDLLISLKDIVFNSEEDARCFTAYLEEGFGFYFDPIE